MIANIPAEDSSWLIALLRDSGPVVIAGFLLLTGIVIAYRYVLKPTLVLLSEITGNCTNAAASNASAARSYTDASKVLENVTTRLVGLSADMERQIDRLSDKRTSHR